MRALFIFLSLIPAVAWASTPKSSGVFFARSKITMSLVVPESDGKKIPKAEKLSVAFCSDSGRRRVKFESRQNESIEQSTQGMPLNMDTPASELKGVRYKVEGYPSTDDECIVVDDAFAASHEYQSLKNYKENEKCDKTLLDKIKKKLPLAQDCSSKAYRSNLVRADFKVKGKNNEYVAFQFGDEIAIEDLGDPNNEYGATTISLIMALINKNGKIRVLMDESHHESVSTGLYEIVNGKRQSLAEDSYYNAGGG